MPSPSDVAWPRDVPANARNESVRVFLRRSTGIIYLGNAQVVRRGQPTRDGFKFLFALSEPLAEAFWQEVVAAANAAPAPAPEEAITSLLPASTTADRVAALRVFCERWHGCSANAPPLETSCTAPGPLRALYGLIQGHVVCVQNHLLAPDKVEVEEGRLVFYVENQGVCSWATEPDGDDPPVFVRLDGRGNPWKLESDSLSAFLIQMLLLEAVFAAPFGASKEELEPRPFAKLKRLVPSLPLPPWASSKTDFIGGGGVIGFVSGDPIRGFDVELAAKEQIRFEPLESLLLDWENRT